jgi:uncharacterized protein
MVTSIPTAGIRRHRQLGEVLIVDFDIHILDERDELVRFCDAPWKQMLEAGPSVPPFGGSTRLYPIFPGHWSTRKIARQSVAELRNSLDDLSIDLGVLFPERVLSIGQQPDAGYAMALVRAYNRWQLETYLQGTRGLYGAVAVAPQDPEGSAREIEQYAREERIVGVMLPTTRLDPAWGHRKYDPIYQASEEANLPIFFHGGAPVQIPMLPFDLRQFDTPFMFHTYTHSIEMMTTLANIMSTGIPARFPQIKMVFIEAGISWVPHAMSRMDRVWEENREVVPFLTERPSAYMRRQMYYATQPIEEPEKLRDMADIIRIIGEDSVLFASDFPHHDFDHPKKVFDIPVEPDVKRKIMGQSGLAVLGIPMLPSTECVPGKAIATLG